MSTDTRSQASAAPRLRPQTSLRLAAAAPDLWRVIDPTGRVVGHLQAASGPLGTKYRARRFHTGTRAFRDLGDFWSADDALDCLRYSR